MTRHRFRRRSEGLGRPGRAWLRPALAAGLALAAVLAAWPAAAQAPALPIFDAHLHYSADAWSLHDPAAIDGALAAAGVRRALTSSSPDEGTLRLHAFNPERFVPSLRPYRGAVHSGNWAAAPSTLEFLRQRLGLPIYRGIGEVHLSSADPDRNPNLRTVLELAVAHDIVLQVHSGAEVVETLLQMEPRLKVLWAHAGLGEPPERIGAALDRHRQLWADLSLREHEIAGDGKLDPAWAALLVRHGDRFLVGSDTWVAGRWAGYADIIAGHRRYLSLLPPTVARAIAYDNAARLLLR